MVNYNWAASATGISRTAWRIYNAYELPEATDTAIVLTDVNARETKSPRRIGLAGYEIAVSGGNFVVQTADIGAT